MLGVGGDMWVLLLVALLTLANTYYSRETKKELNSIRNALLTSTAKASDAVGFERGRQVGKDEQKDEDRR